LTSGSIQRRSGTHAAAAGAFDQQEASMSNNSVNGKANISRRVLVAALGSVAAGVSINGRSEAGNTRLAQVAKPGGTASPKSNSSAPNYVEHRIPRGKSTLYAREFKGSGPALVLLHGFPDNLHIYDEVAPFLAAGGRRVISFDFMGFGKSDRPNGFKYTFEQQRQDLLAVVDALEVEKCIPVGHDAGGPAAINFAIDHPTRTSSLVLINTFYADVPKVGFPEVIELFSDAPLKNLATAFLTDKEKLKWLFQIQLASFQAGQSAFLKDRAASTIQPIILDNLAGDPSAGPAFQGMTADLLATLEYNKKQSSKLSHVAVPVNLVWGIGDKYLTREVADDLASKFKHSAVHPMDAGHWPILDYPEASARLILAAI
jgi:haloalkane dehalogenase